MKIGQGLATLLFISGCTAASAPALAQSTRTWVSGTGDDANPCSRTAPCQSFSGAISKTAASGEIDCLDPSGFGSVTITKAITLKCDAASNGGILVAGTNGITIRASSSDAIVLSGLDLDGVNSGLNGISFVSGGSLTVINTSIRNFTQDGILFAPGNSAALHVLNATIGNSGQSSGYAGIYIEPSGTATAIVTITQTLVARATNGIVADGAMTTGAINGTIRDSDISENAQSGITASNGSATRSTLFLDHISVSGNGVSGLSVTGTNAGMLVGGSTIFANQSGLAATSGGVIDSYGDNKVNGNYGRDGTFSQTVATK